MSLKAKLATMSVAALAMTTPGLANQKTASESAPTPATQKAEPSWYQTAWKYTGGMMGEGISYAGKGLSKAGEGISWTFDKAMWPVRKVGEGTKIVGDFLGKGPQWIEENSGIPMETARSTITAPFGFAYSVTDNLADLSTELPLYGLGMAGSTVNLIGQGVAANTDRMGTAAKNLGSDTWGTTKTLVGDALPLTLDATGIGGVITSVPYGAIARDAIATIHRTTDLVTGQADLSKPLPTDALSIAKYSYDRAMYGKAAADATKGALFASADPSRSTDPSLQKAIKDKMKGYY